MIEWLKAHSDDVSVHGVRGDMAAITRLSDCWTAAEFNAVVDRTAWGDHFTLAAMLGMLQSDHSINAKRTVGEEEEAEDRKRQRQAPAWDAPVAKTSGSERAARAAKTSASARKK